MSLDNIISLENPLNNWFSARDSSNPVLPNPGIMVNKGNHPQLAALFRLVKYYNLHIYIYIYIHLCIYIHIYIYICIYVYKSIPNCSYWFLTGDHTQTHFFGRDTSSCHPIGPLHTRRLSQHCVAPAFLDFPQQPQKTLKT